MPTETAYFDIKAAPIRVRSVRLRVRDLNGTAAFYQTVLGLTPIRQDASGVVLGVGETSLLELVGDPTLTPSDPREAGLFHTAFLMPNRADLARWVAFARRTGVRIQGASDHVVSEAIYLADPEGNGIEIYADRPVGRWRTASGDIVLATRPLDAGDLMRATDCGVWTSFPVGGTVGHVHLRVGDTDMAERFYRDILGFDIAARYDGASFFGSGGYHHQIAGNVWTSSHAGPRPINMAGLDRVELVVRDLATLNAVAQRAGAVGHPAADASGALTLRDPWGTEFRLSAAEKARAALPWAESVS